MIAPVTSFQPGDPSEPADLVRVQTFASRHDAYEQGLAVLAMGLPYWLEESPAGYGILVEPEHAAAVAAELEIVAQANANWPPKPVHLPSTRGPWPWLTPLLWAVVVSWVFQLQLRHWDAIVGWSALDGEAVLARGEWWRPFTALFLHANVGHLVGNLVMGVFVFASVVSAVGIVRAWVDVFVAAGAANVVAALVHRELGSISIGASTAVFAGLGWLTGRAAGAAWRQGASLLSRTVLVPMAAGVILLAWLGSGNLRTDVMAHAAGFACGFVIGLVRGARQRSA